MKRLFLSLFLIFGAFSACFAANNATDIYLLAKTESASELKKVENIDVVDSDGNTALCSAIKYDDVEAYNILKKAGANTEHKCIKKIPSEQYKTFLQKVASASKSWSFLGLGKWGWTAIGVGVAGGAIAAGMSGGSGGGSSEAGAGGATNVVLNCVHGQQNDTVCLCNAGWTGDLCDTPSICDGYTELSCENGYIVSSTCQSGETTYVECEQIQCGANATLSGTQCVCNAGYKNWVTGVGCEPDYQCVGCVHNSNIIVNNSLYAHNSSLTIIHDENESSFYGIKNNAVTTNTAVTTSNAYSNTSSTSTTHSTNEASLYISNYSESTVYGIYGDYNVYNAYAEHKNNSYNASANGVINIDNYGNGDVYGMYGKYARNAYSLRSGGSSSASYGSPSSNGSIIINNYGNGDVYGLCGEDPFNAGAQLSYSGGATLLPNIPSYGLISITNTGNGTVYGVKGSSGAHNGWSNASYVTGIIEIVNIGAGNAYGLYGDVLASNSGNTSTYISIINKNTGTVFGGYGGNYSTNTNTINIQNLGNGFAIGLYGKSNDSIYDSVQNHGLIDINNIGAGTVVGMFGDVNSTITNSGTINITRDAYIDDANIVQSPGGTAGNVIGIYAKSGSTVNNSGTINITTNGTAYGIYVENGSTVTNTGTISINGSSCTGNDCGGNYIVLNGSTLYNSGLMSAKSLNLNSMGGNVVAGANSQFVVDNELSGDLNISSDIVAQGNQTTYIAQNMIDAGDVSGLNVRSASAMFNASLADNGHDVVMQMRDFNELTDNASLAAFLKNNYTNGNGAGLFSTLKSMDNMSAFNNTLSGLTGLNTFTQFAHEDLSAMREISFSMNNKLFENSGRDSFDISDSTGYFSFSSDHNGGSGRYGISSDKISDNWKLGYGMAMANINTGDGDSMHRQNNLWLFYMPATYINDDIELVVAPKAGFAHSEYNRRGYNNINYDGYIEKRIFGLMNDLRYPLTFGNWTFAPDLAFNAIVYDQSGHEQEQEFSLIIPDDRTVSVETGLGFYTKYEKTLQDGSRFKLNSGLMVYREFGDTYDIKLGMRGMDGTFSLYNNDYEYRGAANLGFDYTAGYLHLYGNAQYFMDNDNYMNFKGGVSYRF